MNLAARLRASRIESRNRRAVRRAIDNAATPAMRHELLILTQQQLPYVR